MAIFGRERQQQELNPVEVELLQAKKAASRWPDPYLNKLIIYLEFALDLGLNSREILLSCRDLAGLVDPEVLVCHQKLHRNWQMAVTRVVNISRPPRTITMQLEPEYFRGILDGIKTYEGRAWDPGSPKNYADLRSGDLITFTVNRERPNWLNQCSWWRINPGQKMTVSIEGIYFQPSVHAMYQFAPEVDVGAEFQPYKNGASELLQLQRAATYYGFPGYPEKISQYGFLGIKLGGKTVE